MGTREEHRHKKTVNDALNFLKGMAKSDTVCLMSGVDKGKAAKEFKKKGWEKIPY